MKTSISGVGEERIQPRALGMLRGSSGRASLGWKGPWGAVG